MLDRGESASRYDGSGRWLDVAGQYVTKREVEAILDARGPRRADNARRGGQPFQGLFRALRRLRPQLGRRDLRLAAGARAHRGRDRRRDRGGRNAREAMRRTTDADRERDCSLDMAVSYGLDSDDEREVRDDYYSVRGLK